MNNYLSTKNEDKILAVKSRIRETPTLSTDADSRTNTNLKRLRDLSKKNSPQICVTAIIFLKDKSRNLFKFESVLLSASVERVGASRMRDFLNTDRNAQKKK